LQGDGMQSIDILSLEEYIYLKIPTFEITLNNDCSRLEYRVCGM
jgi:hypothetical protein